VARVEGKIAIVTGGASGLGLAIAERLLLEGAVVILTDIDALAGQRAASELGCTFFHQDVADENSWHELMADTLELHGRLDILVNNAGIFQGQGGNDPESTLLEDFNRIYSINVAGTFLGCKHAIAAMRKCQSRGSIINLSSIAALVSTPFLTAYGASKAAVRQLTMSIAAHCAESGYGIRCNSVHPGQIRTPMLDNLFQDAATSMDVGVDVVEVEFLKKIPLAEFGEPDDVAYLVLYLASDESKHVTGTQMLVDGGMLAHS